MKKFWLLLLVLLVLSGCAVQEVPETVESSTTTELPTTEETIPAGYYVPDSELETKTGGTIRQYNLPGNGYRSVYAIGDQLLLTSRAFNPELLVLTGEDCAPTATFTLPAEDGYALYNGYVYYEAQSKQLVFLDAQLNEASRLQVPENTLGVPLVAPDGEEVFYCVDKNIYALDVTRNLSRLIKTHTYTEMNLKQCYFDGDLISCRVDGDKTIYVSTETGQTMYAQNDVQDLFTYEKNYLALRTDGSVQQRIVGTLDTDGMQLNIPDEYVLGALELGGYLGWSLQEDSTLAFNFYDAETGKKTATITLPNMGAPVDAYADRWSNSIWILVNEGKTLLQWQYKYSAVEEEANYLTEIYTAEIPDKVNLAICEDRAKTFNKSNGVLVRVWEDAVEHPGPYELEAEYQPEAIHNLLNDLLPILREFPSKFLKKSASEKIRICLVRSIDGKQQAVQFWDGKYPYIIITAGTDLRSEFMRCIGYIVDSHVLGNSPDYDYWSTLNPEGFAYGAEEQNPEYAKGENRYFTSENAMKSPVEDRCEIFHQAMLENNAQMFQSTAMQSKLKMLCVAIREAWDKEKDENILPWEQYLAKPIAYKK